MKKSLFIILLIFILPIALYLVFEMKSSYSFATNGEIIIYKFTSPMCSECQVVQKIIDDIKDDYEYVVFDEINVSGKNASKKEVSRLIKKYDITVVPTLVFLDSQGNFHKKIEVDMTKDDIVNTIKDIRNQKDY